MPIVSRAGRLAALAALVSASAVLRGPAAAQEPAQNPAQEVKAGDLVIRHAWARATPNGAQVAGGYLSVTNNGSAPDTLTGGSAEVAARFELHDMRIENGVMRMRPAGPLVIPPGATVTLAPAGRHIMMTGLKHGLRKGDVVEGTLTFARAGTVPVRFSVEGIGAGAPAKAGTAGHAMSGMKM